MSKSVFSLALAGMMVLAGCGGEPQEQKAAATPAPEVKKEEPPPPLYDITKESLTSHPDWTSKNVQVLGTKIGDKTTAVQNNFGKLENTRTLPQRGTEPAEYLTIYQGNGLFVYTQQLTGKLIKFEVYDTFSKQLADDKLKKLLSGGDLKYMREILGPEEKTEENTDDQSTEYVYDSKGFRFVKFKVNGKTLNCLRFSEVKKTAS